MSLRKNTFTIAVFVSLLGIVGCKEKFLPQIKDYNLNYLVIEGLINTGQDSTIFNISRTYKLDGKAVVAPEKGAVVQVESEDGNTYVLPETVKSGKYGRIIMDLNPSKKYRLRIRTNGNREYLSDFVESKTSPPIDEIHYNFENNHLNISSNTHDPAGNSKYYLYSFDETVEYRAALKSLFEVADNKVVDRAWPDGYIWTCWRFIPSNTIILGSTIALTEDKLSDQFITSVPRGSLKIRYGYSILLKQRVLTKQGFEFYESLRKNTESLGSIFDAQPSQLFGNIHATTNPAEIVIGFVSAGNVTAKRLTVYLTDMPVEWFEPPPPIDSACLATVKAMSEVDIVAQHPVWVPIQRTPVPQIRPPWLYDATNNMYCVDCRKQGGVNIKPTYWR